MKIIKKYRLKRKIRKQEKALHKIIFYEIFNEYETDTYAIKQLLEFNLTTLTTKEWSLGNRLDLMFEIKKYKTEDILTSKTFNKLKNIYRLKKYLSLL